jgi:hypothetical protein
VIGYRALDRIGQTLAPVMLRRRKAEVLTQLPERVDKRIFVPLTPEQRVHITTRTAASSRASSRAGGRSGYLSDADQRRLQCALQNMRMACNSTYLLDHETDHGQQGRRVDDRCSTNCSKTRQAKAVVFSQWLGTHELIVRRLAIASAKVRATRLPRAVSGSVPGDKRGALVEQFHHDPDCRVFLSTDAGGVGLNLQHAAAVVVNMDMPWNPAVLEQRIGRVHRMGQSRGVQVVNFVGQGSIEEGMLSVLAFKKSLFAGVLDGGESEKSSCRARDLSKFMESVEQVAGAMGEADGDIASVPPHAAADAPDLTPSPVDVPLTRDEMPLAAEAETAEPAPPPAGDPWAAIIQAGAALLQGLATARSAGGAGPITIERDPVTGQASVRLPLPEPAVLQQLAKAFEPLNCPHAPISPTPLLQLISRAEALMSRLESVLPHTCKRPIGPLRSPFATASARAPARSSR